MVASAAAASGVPRVIFVDGVNHRLRYQCCAGVIKVNRRQAVSDLVQRGKISPEFLHRNCSFHGKLPLKRRPFIPRGYCFGRQRFLSAIIRRWGVLVVISLPTLSAPSLAWQAARTRARRRRDKSRWSQPARWTPWSFLQRQWRPKVHSHAEFH